MRSSLPIDNAFLLPVHALRYEKNMGLKLKDGGLDRSATTSNASPKVRHDISFVSRMLTPSERDLLKRDLKDTIEIAKRTK
jgi:hypothetical protein